MMLAEFDPMLLIAVNLIFAVVTLLFARTAFIRAFPFIRTGWTAIRAATQHPDFRRDVNLRRVISDGGGFLIGGVIWLVIGVGAVGLGVFFGVQAAWFWLDPPA